jgi:hypothetical protein
MRLTSLRPLALSPVVLVAGMMSAQALTLELNPGVTLEMSEPAGFCVVDPARSATDRQAYEAAQAVHSGVNKMLAYFVECEVLEAARQGRPADLQRWIVVLAQMQDGRVRSVERVTRPEYIVEIGKEIAKSGEPIANTAAKELTEKLAARLKDSTVSVGLQQMLGELERDDNGLYVGMRSVNRRAGREQQVAAIVGFTFVRKHSITMNSYRPYNGPRDFEVLLGVTRALTADLVKRNEPAGAAATERGYFDWGKIAKNALVGGLVAAAVVGVVSLWRRMRRPKRPLG